MSIPLPEGKFAAILADPPWRFETFSGPAVPTTAPDPYETMETGEIMHLPVSDMAEDDCVLFIWATWPCLLDALRVVTAWGFEYKTEAFTWVKVLQEAPRKPRMGMGYWTMSNTEPCLLATRGKPKRLHKDVGQVIAAPIREHSRKPDETHSRIERLVAGPYLELFGRQQRPGWTVWGNETDKFTDLTLPLDGAAYGL